MKVGTIEDSPYEQVIEHSSLCAEIAAISFASHLPVRTLHDKTRDEFCLQNPQTVQIIFHQTNSGKSLRGKAHLLPKSLCVT
jgi:hypothetical protein